MSRKKNSCIASTVLKVDNLCPRNSPRITIFERYRMEIVALQDLFASTDSVRTGRVIEADTGPLIDGKRFVSVHEPRKISHPVQVDRDRPVAQKESANVQ